MEPIDTIIEIRLSFNYNRVLNHEVNKNDLLSVWPDFVAQCKLFEQFYEPLAETVKMAIPRYTGCEWGKYSPKAIPVYLTASSTVKTLIDPVTLSFEADLIEMLGKLIFLLTYNNILFLKLRDGALKNACSSQIACLILDQLYPESLTQKEAVRHMASDMAGRELLSGYTIDLNTETLLQFASKKQLLV